MLGGGTASSVGVFVVLCPQCVVHVEWELLAGYLVDGVGDSVVYFHDAEGDLCLVGCDLRGVLDLGDVELDVGAGFDGFEIVDLDDWA